MESEFLNQLLGSIDDTMLVYDEEHNLVYKNHDFLADQKMSKTKSINIMGKNYIIAFWSKNKLDVDVLTGVLTKGSFNEEISTLGDMNNCTIVFCDIDNLKYYNERYGHIETDKVIKGIANTITSNVRAGDIVARFGGDEFVILLCGTDSAKSYTRIESIRKIICSTPYNLKRVDGINENVHVSMTFGIADVDMDISKSMFDADNLLINGKKIEKNKVYIKK